MKIIIKIISAFILFLALVTTANAQETIEVSVDDWPPYIAKEQKHYGVVPHIVTEAFALEGIQVKYVWAKWRRAYEGVKDGTWDASPTWLITDERRAEVTFNEIPLFELSRVFYHLKSIPLQWRSLEDVKDYSIGAVIGYTYGEDFNNAEKEEKIKVERVSSEDTNFKKLARGRVDLIVSNPFTGYSVAKQYMSPEDYAQLTHHPRTLAKPDPTFMIFPKGEKGNRLKEIFDRGFKKLVASGKIDQYFEDSRQGRYKSDCK